MKRFRVRLALQDHLGADRGLDFLTAARAGGFAGRVIVVTAGLSDATAQMLIRQGIDGIFFKDKPLQALLEFLKRLAGIASRLQNIADGLVAEA